MKYLKLSTLFLCIAMFALTSCKSDGTSSDSTTSTEDTKAVPAAATTAETGTAAANAAEEPAVPAGPLTSIEFGESTYDFGEIMEGDKANYKYEFTNTGEEPLIISNAKGSCGCTVPEWPRTPIAPGETASIDVQFDSKGKGKVGGNPQSKRVTITANTDPANTYLTIKGIVNKEEGADAAAQ